MVSLSRYSFDNHRSLCKRSWFHTNPYSLSLPFLRKFTIHILPDSRQRAKRKFFPCLILLGR